MLGDIPRFVDDIDDRECSVSLAVISLIIFRIRDGHSPATTHSSRAFKRRLMEESKTDPSRPTHEAL